MAVTKGDAVMKITLVNIHNTPELLKLLKRLALDNGYVLDPNVNDHNVNWRDLPNQTPKWIGVGKQYSSSDENYVIWAKNDSFIPGPGDKCLDAFRELDVVVKLFSKQPKNIVIGSLKVTVYSDGSAYCEGPTRDFSTNEKQVEELLEAIRDNKK
jgi:hypothetical protein